MAVELTRAAASAVRRGHPWVYREGVSKSARARDMETGTSVTVTDETGAPLGRGLWDATSPIALRVFDQKANEPLTARELAKLVLAAAARRDGRFDDDTTAFRLCNGEGDRVPGFVADRYGDAVVLRLDTDAWQPHLAAVVKAMAGPLHARGVRSIGVRVAEDPIKLRHFEGDPPPERVMIRERGMAMEVDLARGQKTGAFLDQRENRARVRALVGSVGSVRSVGKGRVLNLFSYAGGFSIAAALGGATQVTSVDVASGGHASAQRSFRENGLDPTGHTFVTADVFEFLDRAKKRGDRFDVVISDPPSFAPSEKARSRGLAAYKKLHAAAASVVADHGILCAASCSSHVTLEDFLGTLDDQAVGRGDLVVREIHGQPEDHPSLAAWPEGRYLKFVVLG